MVAKNKRVVTRYIGYNGYFCMRPLLICDTSIRDTLKVWHARRFSLCFIKILESEQREKPISFIMKWMFFFFLGNNLRDSKNDSKCSLFSRKFHMECSPSLSKL